MRLVLGFAIGVALGLVFAPASGEKTRAQLKLGRDVAQAAVKAVSSEVLNENDPGQRA